MHRKTLLASALAVLMAGSASLVLAQSTPTTPITASSSSSTMKTAKTMKDHGNRHGDWRGNRMHSMGHDQQGGVIGDMRGLERLYMQSGRSKELTALYNEVLAKSQDPRVRNYTYQRLARLQARPANVDQAIATLRKGLDESLANEAKMRTDREAMRANWQQRHDNVKTPAPAQPAAAQ